MVRKVPAPSPVIAKTSRTQEGSQEPSTLIRRIRHGGGRYMVATHLDARNPLHDLGPVGSIENSGVAALVRAWIFFSDAHRPTAAATCSGSRRPPGDGITGLRTLEVTGYNGTFAVEGGRARKSVEFFQRRPPPHGGGYATYPPPTLE